MDWENSLVAIVSLSFELDASVFFVLGTHESKIVSHRDPPSISLTSFGRIVRSHEKMRCRSGPVLSDEKDRGVRGPGSLIYVTCKNGSSN